MLLKVVYSTDLLPCETDGSTGWGLINLRARLACAAPIPEWRRRRVRTDSVMRVRIAGRRAKAFRMRQVAASKIVAAEKAGCRRNAAALMGIWLVPLLSGCIIGTEKPDPAIPMPPAYRHAAPAAAHTAVPALDWWRSFRSPELTLLIEEAQTANLDIAVAIGRVLQADAQAKIAGAPLFPNADLNASANRSRPSQATGSGGGGGGGPSERTLYNVSA